MSMLNHAAVEFLKPVYEYLRQNILCQLEWTDFTCRLETYLTRRQSNSMTPVDIFPLFACLAAGGSVDQAIPATAAWLLFILSARIFDDLGDGQHLAEEWHGSGTQTTLAMGLFALGAANSAVAQISSGAVSKEISCAFNQAVALAAKAQQGPITSDAFSVREYLSAITTKTGLIFAVGAWSGGVVAVGNSGEQTLNSLFQYGLNVGLMDQIIDDCQDIAADLAHGVWTLPTIYTLTQLEEDERRLLLNALSKARSGGGATVDTAMNYVNATHSLVWCLRVATAYQERALNALRNLPADKIVYLTEYAKRNDIAVVV